MKSFCRFSSKKRLIIMGRAKRLFSLVLLFVLTFSFAVIFLDKNVSAETVSGTDYDEVNVEFSGQNEGYSAGASLWAGL